MFDFVQFCEENNIPYVTRGVNKKVADDCNISCPFCNATSDGDPSFHLGVNSELGVYSCWRNQRKHRGRTLHRLIMQLLRCSYYQACDVLGQQPTWLQEGKFETLADKGENLFDDAPIIINSLDIPDEFRKFGSGFNSEKRFIDYLVNDRGFATKQLPKLTQQYQLHWSINGRYKDRVIIPIIQNHEWVGWTGRTIHKASPVRYLTTSSIENAPVNVKDIIFNWDTLIEDPLQVVIVTEGPFDGIKIDFFGQNFGVRGTCLFGQNGTLEQLAYVAALTDLYQLVIFIFDDTSTLLAEAMVDQLPGMRVIAQTLPEGIHDPGELTYAQVWKLSKQWLHQIPL